MIKLLFGLSFGVLAFFFVWLIMDQLNEPIIETRKCMTQQIYLIDPSSGGNSPFIIIGESVICARDWQISNIYGPDAEAFYGKIKLRDWDTKEFVKEKDNN